MAKFQPWLKMWVEWIDDPKMLSLSLAEQGAWWRLLTLAKKCMADGFLVKGNGAPLSLNEIASTLRISTKPDRKVFDSMIKKMTDQGSLEWNSNALVITHFAERQAKTTSETPAALRDRQQRRRMKLWEDYGIKDSAIPLETRLLVIERDKCLCQHCGKQGIRATTNSSVVLDPEDSTPFEFDHIIPRAQGGPDDPENLLLSCRPCNRKRRNLSARENESSKESVPSPPKDKDIDTEVEVEDRRDNIVTNLLQLSTPEAILAEISNFHEQNFGIITPILSEKFKDFCKNYRGPVGWIKDAFAEAVTNNVRKWAYVEAILERWQTEGFKAPKKKPPAHRPGKVPTEEELKQQEIERGLN